MPSMIVFHYNLVTLIRSLQVRKVASSQGNRAEPMRLTELLVESFVPEVTVDATDRLEKAESGTVQRGIHPRLATAIYGGL